MQRGPPAEDAHSHPREEQRGGGGPERPGWTGRDGEEAGMLAGVGAESRPAPLQGVQEARAGEASGRGTGAWAANSRGSQHTGSDG